MSAQLTITAGCVAAFARLLADLPHETRAVVTAVDPSGEPWATVDIAPMTDSRRAVFPNYPGGGRGDTRRRGQSGAIVARGDRSALPVVIDRARRAAAYASDELLWFWSDNPRLTFEAWLGSSDAVKSAAISF